MRDAPLAGSLAAWRGTTVDRWSTALAGAVLLLYLVTLSGGAFPGRSADLIVKALGLEPRPSPAQPLWFWTTRLFAVSPDAAWRLNVFSALCAAVSVSLLGWLLRRMVLLWAEARELAPDDGRVLARLAALAGGAALALSPAFWQAATRAHVGTFDAVLLLVWGVFLVRFVELGKLRWLYLFAAWGGMSAVQSVSFLWLTLPAAFGCCWLLYQQYRVRARLLAAMAGLAAGAFFLVTVAQALSYAGTDGHRLTGNLSFWRLVAACWLGHARLMRLGVSAPGWLLNVVMLVIPWLVCLGTVIWPRRAGSGAEVSVAHAPGLHALAAILAAGVLVDAPFSPHVQIGDKHTLLLPYVLSAMSFGWLSAYWCHAAGCAALLRSGWTARGRTAARAGVMAVTALLLVVALLGNRRGADGRSGELVRAYAKEVVAAVGDRTWLLTGGNLDSVLMVEAHQQSRLLRVLNISRMRSESYREHVADRFDDPQLGNACRLGFMPLVREWFGCKTNTLDRVAVMTLPDLWYAAGMEPVPNLLVFTGATEEQAPDAKTVWAEHERGWARLEPLLRPDEHDLPEFAVLRADCRRHASLVANNVGVWLEDRGDAALAEQAYWRARRFEPYNVSALLNLSALAQAGTLTNGAEMIRSEVRDLSKAAPTFDWWSLMRRYGYVRKAEAYAAIGQAWARSGEPGLQAACLRKAADLRAGPASEALWQVKRAQLYARDGRREESRALLEQRLSQVPDDPVALLGMADLALARHNATEAVEWLTRAEAGGTLSVELTLSAAGLFSRASELARARALVQRVVDDANDNLPAWAMLAGIVIAQRDEAATARCLRELQRLEKGRGFNGLCSEALIAMDRGDLPGARTLFTDAVRCRPDNVEALDRLLRLDVVLGLRPESVENARLLATRDPGNATAPYVLGLAHMRKAQMDEARPWLEKSVALDAAPDRLNDLAWVLQELGDLSAAEQHARAAVAAAPRLAPAWDTLGVVLTKRGGLDEAAQALERALATGGREPLALAHLARVRTLQGDLTEARRLLEETTILPRDLTPDGLAEVRAVRDLIRASPRK